MAKLGDVFSLQITGEWGSECDTNQVGIKILRTTNFTSNGTIDYSNIAVRKVTESKIEKKKLKKGDIILEKSGGTEKTPVGRVVFCDDAIEKDTYLCNNFTQAMRVNTNLACPRYVFYFMWYLHYSGKTDLLQNKTTGIRNLRVKSYLDEEIPLPPLEEQRYIAAVLDKVTALIAQRRAQLDKLDLLVKSRFVEMFEQGNYPKVKASEICDFITKGTTPPADEIFKEDSPSRIPFLKVYNLSFTGELLFEQNPQYIERNIHEGRLSRSKVYPNDVLMNIVGPPLGKFALIPENYETLNINQAIAIFRAKEKILPRFLLAALMQPEVLKPFMDQAVGVRQQNLSLEQCRNLEISLPNIELQKQFVKFAEQVEKSKLTIRQSLDKLQIMKKSIMQSCFG